MMTPDDLRAAADQLDAIACGSFRVSPLGSDLARLRAWVKVHGPKPGAGGFPRAANGAEPHGTGVYLVALAERLRELSAG